MLTKNMEKSELFRVVVWLLVLALGVAAVNGEIKTFRSQPFSLGPGDVVETVKKLEMPSGHVGLRSLRGELVDEDDNPVPLSDVYLHHWRAGKLHIKRDSLRFGEDSYLVPISGICQVDPQDLSLFYSFGSETRHTSYSIPEPYAIESGNPEEIPDGYEEQWLFNLHAIDTRGAVNKRHCYECLCTSYNISVTRTGKKVPEEYVGGLECCNDGARCALKEGVVGTKRKLYFQYTVEYVPMEPPVKPVRIYVVDVTDDRTSVKEEPRCKVEYEVLPCDESKDDVCRNEKTAVTWFPEEKEVDLVHAVGHLHSGGVYLEMRGEDGRKICTSQAVYGTGHEAGNETGYVVGMGSCYPEVGTQRIKPGEKLHLKAVYNSEESHTGVMGMLHFVVADPVSNQRDSLSGVWKIAGAVVVVAVAIIGFSLIRYVRSKGDGMGYEALVQA